MANYILNRTAQQVSDILDGVYSANGVLQSNGLGTVTAKTVDSSPTASSTNLVTSGGVASALAGKQNTLSNASLLATYTQTEANLASAVSLKHSHSNKAILDTIPSSGTTGYVLKKTESGTAWDESVTVAQLFALLPTDTVSGAVASFPDGADDVPIESLSVALEPIQDLHGYDHPWAGGAGKNILNPDNVEVGWFSATGTDITYNASYRTISIPNLKAGTYTMSVWWNDTASLLRKYSDGSIRTISSSNNNYTFTTTTDGLFMLCFRNTSSTEITTTPNISVVSGSFVPAAFEPYSNICPITGWSNVNVYREAQYDAGATPHVTINLNGTVYGGSLNVTTGVLTVDMAKGTLSKNDDIGAYDYSGHLGVRHNNVIQGGSRQSGISSHSTLKNGSSPNSQYMWAGVNGNTSVYWIGILDVLGLSTLDEYKTWLDGQTVEVVYELPTPQTYQLTPTEISTLLGNNTVWSDSGDVAVTYKANIQKYIDKKIAEL